MDQLRQKGQTEAKVHGQIEPQPDEKRRGPADPVAAVKEDGQANHLDEDNRRAQNGQAQPPVTVQPEGADGPIHDRSVRAGPGPEVPAAHKHSVTEGHASHAHRDVVHNPGHAVTPQSDDAQGGLQQETSQNNYTQSTEYVHRPPSTDQAPAAFRPEADLH